MASGGANGLTNPCQLTVSFASGSGTIYTGAVDITPAVTFAAAGNVWLEHTVVFYVQVDSGPGTFTCTFSFGGSTFAGLNWHIFAGKLMTVPLT